MDISPAIDSFAQMSSPPVDKPLPGTSRAEARAAAEKFEAAFLSELMGYMYQGIQTDGPFGGGHGEEMMRSMLVGEYGKAITARGGIGIADAVYRELIEIQEGSYDVPARAE